MLLNRLESRYIVNMHQTSFDCEELNLLFKSRADNKAIPEAKLPTEKNKSDKGGKKSILDRFPNIPEYTPLIFIIFDWLYWKWALKQVFLSFWLSVVLLLLFLEL